MRSRAVARQHGIGDAGCFAVAGIVRSGGEELVGVPRLAGEGGVAAGAGNLVLPDHEVAAVFGDVDRDVFDAAGVVDRVPADVVGRVAVGIGAARGCREGGLGRRGVERIGDAGAGHRRVVVEPDGRRSRNPGAADGGRAGLHGIADVA